MTPSLTVARAVGASATGLPATGVSASDRPKTAATAPPTATPDAMGAASTPAATSPAARPDHKDTLRPFSALMRGLTLAQPDAEARPSEATTGEDQDSAAADPAALDASGAAGPSAEGTPATHTHRADEAGLPSMVMPMVALPADAVPSGLTASPGSLSIHLPGEASFAPWCGGMPGVATRIEHPRASAATPAAADAGDSVHGLPSPALSSMTRTAANSAAGQDDLAADRSSHANNVPGIAAALNSPPEEDGKSQTNTLIPSAATAAMPSTSAAQATSTQSLPTLTLKLTDGNPSQWRQPLAEALGDRLQLQVSSNVQQAVIRLEPPMLGRIDISIRHEAGELQVHLSATNADVVQQLNGVGNSLRQDLEARQSGSVAVTVTDASRELSKNASQGGDPRQHARQGEADDQAPGHALAEAELGMKRRAFNLSRRNT